MKDVYEGRKKKRRTFERLRKGLAEERETIRESLVSGKKLLHCSQGRDKSFSDKEEREKRKKKKREETKTKRRFSEEARGGGL